MVPALYGYFRSSAAYRVRIALYLKGVPAQPVPVHLLRGGGEQRQAAFRQLNPQGLVPVWQEDGWSLSQSLAIMEYLDETYPGPLLLPGDARMRARVRQIALAVACDIHPLNNLRVLQYLGGSLGAGEGAKKTWIAHWIQEGLGALEAELAPEGLGARFCLGSQATMGDCCLIPQLFNARRFGVDLRPYPTLQAIEAHCQALPAFRLAHPSVQIDAE